MSDPYHSKPGSRPGSGGPGRPTSAPSGPTPPNQKAPQSSGGRVVHDSRGNAIWQWVKDAGRAAIESTSTLLKKLEAPHLKVDDTKNNELRLEDADPGGGYDPYGSSVGSRKPPPPKTPLPKKK
jgi:hypothetical protein